MCISMCISMWFYNVREATRMTTNTDIYTHIHVLSAGAIAIYIYIYICTYVHYIHIMNSGHMCFVHQWSSHRCSETLVQLQQQQQQQQQQQSAIVIVAVAVAVVVVVVLVLIVFASIAYRLYECLLDSSHLSSVDNVCVLCQCFLYITGIFRDTLLGTPISRSMVCHCCIYS